VGSKDKNSPLGLSLEELELLVKNTDNSRLLKEYEAKLDNCDLSRSAIELINEKDLAAVNRIANSVHHKFTTNQKSNGFNYMLLGVAALLLILGGILYSESGASTTKRANPSQVETNATLSKAESNITPTENEQFVSSMSPQKKQVLNTSNEIRTVKLKADSSLIQTEYSLDSLKADLKDEEAILPVSKIEQGDKKEKTEVIYRKPARQVRAIKIVKNVPDKFKGENYTMSDLVSYNGGETQLELMLLDKLKGNIKDSDIPKNHFSVVFKFSVTSKGKVKDINIQSLATPELEQLIIEHTRNLHQWNKGKKRIPLDYTVYITFK